MTLRRRVGQLEARKAPPDRSDHHARLAARLDRIQASVVASADFSHRQDASPAENLVRAWLRGDGETARGILARATEARP